MPVITGFDVVDVRFPTSLDLDGSDAMNKDGDYSSAYVVLTTDDPLLCGFGLSFTIGRGTELVVAAARLQAALLVGLDVEVMLADMGAVYRRLTADSQLRWLGPEKGVVHLSLAAVLNAAWDVVARLAGKPLWRLLAEMPAAQLAAVADLRYCADVLTRQEATAMLAAVGAVAGASGSRCWRRRGIRVTPPSPAGWVMTMRSCAGLCQEAVDAGFPTSSSRWGRTWMMIAAGARSRGRCWARIAHLMIDANQVWEVPQAIEWVNALAEFDRCGSRSRPAPMTFWGTRRSAPEVAPIGVATGEHGHNRVMFKQLLQAGAIDFCQIDFVPAGERERDHHRVVCWRRSSGCRSARTPAGSGCANSCSTCRSSTTSPCRARSTAGSPSTSTICTNISSTPAWSRAPPTSCRPRPATARKCSTPPSPTTASPTAPTGPAAPTCSPPPHIHIRARDPCPHRDD